MFSAANAGLYAREQVFYVKRSGEVFELGETPVQVPGLPEGAGPCRIHPPSLLIRIAGQFGQACAPALSRLSPAARDLLDWIAWDAATGPDVDLAALEELCDAGLVHRHVGDEGPSLTPSGREWLSELSLAVVGHAWVFGRPSGIYRHGDQRFVVRPDEHVLAITGDGAVLGEVGRFGLPASAARIEAGELPPSALVRLARGLAVPLPDALHELGPDAFDLLDALCGAGPVRVDWVDLRELCLAGLVEREDDELVRVTATCTSLLDAICVAVCGLRWTAREARA